MTTTNKKYVAERNGTQNKKEKKQHEGGNGAHLFFLFWKELVCLIGKMMIVVEKKVKLFFRRAQPDVYMLGDVPVWVANRIVGGAMSSFFFISHTLHEFINTLKVEMSTSVTTRSTRSSSRSIPRRLHQVESRVAQKKSDEGHGRKKNYDETSCVWSEQQKRPKQKSSEVKDRGRELSEVEAGRELHVI